MVRSISCRMQWGGYSPSLLTSDVLLAHSLCAGKHNSSCPCFDMLYGFRNNGLSPLCLCAFASDVVLHHSAGVKNAVAACCGAPPPLFALVFCGKDYAFPNGTTIPFTLCGNREDYLYWDLIHPTHVGHRGFANNFWSGGKEKMYPMNLKELVERRA